jgi:hypothetical protein
MKTKFLILSVVLVLSSYFIIGWVTNDPFSSRTQQSVEATNYTPAPVSNHSDNTPVYVDDFDALNDTAALRLRGYLVYRNGGPPGLAAPWFQGNATVFPAYNGPPNGYVASNFQTTIGKNIIDNWLVLPRVPIRGILVGDSLYFRSRSPLGSTFPDSIKVEYSANDSTPSGTWTRLGWFRVNVAGTWEKRGFRAPTTSMNGRFAIRYGCVHGGPNGPDTDFSGIDELYVEGSGSVGVNGNQNEIPDTYRLDQNYPNPFNPSTVISYALPKAGNVKIAVYDMLGNEVSVLINEHRAAGFYSIEFDASRLSSGVYFYRLESGSFTFTRKMSVVK